MPKPYDYENRWVVSLGEVADNDVVTEVDGYRAPTIHARQFEHVEPGAAFPSIGAWVAAMDAETARLAPWAKRQHKLSSIAERSSVVWVESAGHYMEVRRGSKTKFAAGERRTWATVDEWLVSLTPPPVKKEEAPAPAVVKAFDAEKFKETWINLRDLTKKETGTLRSAYVMQLCQFLLDSRPAAEDWLAENPTWRYSARAIVQDFSLNPGHTVAHDAVAAFLAIF